VPLNGSLVVELDATLDPLSVGPSSVIVRADDGSALACRLIVSGGQLMVVLQLDGPLLRQPPSHVEVVLAGLPSVHALTFLDGRRLSRTQRLRFELRPVLTMQAAGPVRLVEVAGRGVPPGDEVPLDGPLTLHFAGVLDPNTIRPEACPLYPVESGLVLTEPVLPAVEWTCVGERFEVTLDPGPARGRLQLDLRRFGLRDLEGRPPEPALVVQLITS
jgi:hypothetical protein